MAYLDNTGVETLASELKSYADETYLTNSPIASIYNTSSSYDVGDYCLKSGVLYRCITAIGDGGETWNSAHWTPVTIIDELITTKSAASTATSIANSAIPKLGSITLGTSWTAADPTNVTFTQSVTLSGVTITPNTKIDLHPTTSAVVQMIADEVSSIFIINNNGVLTANAINAAPTESLTFQYAIYETIV